MAAQRYMFNRDWIATHVFSVSENPNVPLKTCQRKFRRGDIFWGELKHKNNQPAFVAVLGTPGVLVVPTNVVGEVVTKKEDGSGSSSADGATKAIIATNPKVQYADAAIVGGLVGFGLIYLAEKKGWLKTIETKNRIVGTVAFAALAVYLVYRHKNAKKDDKNKQ